MTDTKEIRMDEKQQAEAAKTERDYRDFVARTAASPCRADKTLLRGRGGS